MLSRIDRQGEKDRELSEEELDKKDALTSVFVCVECGILAHAKIARHCCVGASRKREA